MAKAKKTVKNNSKAKKAKNNNSQKSGISAPEIVSTTSRAAAKEDGKKMFVRHVGNTHPVFGPFVSGEGYVGGEAAFVKTKASLGTPIGVFVGNRSDVVIGMKENDNITTRILTPKEARYLGEILLQASNFSKKNKKVNKVLKNATSTSKTKETAEA